MRAFEFDAFISHNSLDGAKKIAGDLRSRGTLVFCDELVDLSAQRVLDRLTQSLSRSRSVVLHLHPDYRDSAWCRAEYRAALAQSNKFSLPRVVVARTSPDVEIPPRLVSVPKFDLPQDTDSLAEFLIESNRIPDDISAEVVSQEEHALDNSLCCHKTVEVDGMEMLANVSMLRDHLERNAALLPSEKADELLRYARVCVEAVNSELRTNGHRALILLAALQDDLQTLEEIKAYIRRERDEAVLKEILWTYLYAGLPAEEGDHWLAAALIRATSGAYTFENSHVYLDTLPDPVRCRVVLGTISLLPIAAAERMSLLERWLDMVSTKNKTLEPIEPFAIEGSLREILPWLDGPEATGLRVDYRRVVLKIIKLGKRSGGGLLRAMGPPACDVLVEPLARSLGDTEASVEEFESVCQVVAGTVTGAQDLVGVLREMGHIISKGGSWNEAQAHADEVCEERRNSEVRRMDEGGLS